MANVIDGLHMTVDGVTDDPGLFSQENLSILIKELAKALEMDIIYGPIFKSVELDPSKLTGNSFQDEGGVSGFCMISTSHISIHVWPLRKMFMLDSFSCKSFDHELALEIIEKCLSTKTCSVNLLRRDFYQRISTNSTRVKEIETTA